MANDWVELTLGDIANPSDGAVDGPFGSNLPASSYVDSGIPVIRGSNLSVGLDRFKDDDFVYVSEDTLSRLKRSECLVDDIIFTKKGTLGQTGFISHKLKFDRYLLSSNQMRLRVNQEIADPEYVFYWVSSAAAIEKIRRDSESTGVPKINLDYLKKFPIRLPSLKMQRAIVHVLSSFGSRIELNRQTNQTLESMAQALFKSWFVDFDPVIDNALAAGNTIPEPLQKRAEQRRALREADAPDQQATAPLPEAIRQLFPASFVFDADMGWIPEGWEVGSLEKLIKLTGGGTPKTSVEEYWNGDIPWFSVVDAPSDSDVYVIDTEKHVTQLGINNSSTKLLRRGTTIISARGTVGKCAMVANPMTMNQSCYAVNGAEGVSDEFVYYLLRYQVSDLQQRSHGSVFSTITRDTFKSISLPFSGGELTQCFSEVVKPFFNKILANSKNGAELTKLRDTLLPKLISGELRLPSEASEAQQQAEATLTREH